LDPSHTEESTPLVADKGLAATAQRKVDASAFQGMRALRKEDRVEEYLPAVKKGKKGKKSPAAAAETPAAGKYSCPPSVIEDCAFIGVEPPMSATEVPAVAEKVKAKIAHWKADQEEQTKKVCLSSPHALQHNPSLTPGLQNIEKAKKEIERLEAEEAAPAPAEGSGASTPAKGVNGKEAEQPVVEAAKEVLETPKEVAATA
jgi:hypothetical protein